MTIEQSQDSSVQYKTKRQLVFCDGNFYNDNNGKFRNDNHEPYLFCPPIIAMKFNRNKKTLNKGAVLLMLSNVDSHFKCLPFTPI